MRRFKNIGGLLSTACALVDMRNSTLTLRVRDDLVIFEAKKKENHKEAKEHKVHQ